MTDHLELALPNRQSAIPGLQDRLEAFAGDHGLPGTVLYALQLALEEHLTNIVSYGYEDQGSHQIRVRVELGTQGLRAVVEDDGIPFDPLQLPAPDVSIPMAERAIGGLGVHMMRNAVDDLAYRRDGDRNILVITKRIPASPKA